MRNYNRYSDTTTNVNSAWEVQKPKEVAKLCDALKKYGIANSFAKEILSSDAGKNFVSYVLNEDVWECRKLICKELRYYVAKLDGNFGEYISEILSIMERYSARSFIWWYEESPIWQEYDHAGMAYEWVLSYIIIMHEIKTNA